MSVKQHLPQRIAADNRRARFNYEILEEIEVGICLVGTEVKSLREGKANIQDAYAEEKDGALWLINAYIPEYKQGNRFNHETRRPRKLLLHRREINKMGGKSLVKGLTIIPLSLYFNEKGRAKILLALAKGKATHDKRQSIKDRDWKRDKARMMKEGG